MKHAQDVAQAVVRSRSSLSSWTCIGPRRRVVHASSNSKLDDLPEAPLITERTSVSTMTEVVTMGSDSNNAEHCFSHSDSGDETEAEEDLIQVDRVIAGSTLEDITEGELWYELEKELQRRESESTIQAQEEEEAAAAKEITEEEKVLADAVESYTPISASDVSDNLQFYPPGRIMHMICIPPSEADDFSNDGPKTEHVGIYETPRELYSKLRLSRTMINDHYMPMYKKMMEQLIQELENQED